MSRIRYDLSHPKGQKNLQIYEDAIAMMKGEKQLPKNVLNSDARKYLDKNKDNFIDSDSSYNWQNYASIHEEQCAHFTEHFLPWHRVYINYFEKAVRTITGVPKFTLPYWNYNDPSQRYLPEAFSKKNSPLYEQSRNKKINKREIEIQAANIDEDDSLYINPQNYTYFSSWIELHPHSDFHFQIGGVAAPTGTAALDPIFWMNHNNLDRLWAKFAPYEISKKDLESFDKLEDSRHPVSYIFPDGKGGTTVNLLNKPAKLLKIIQESNISYKDKDEGGNPINIPTKPASQRSPKKHSKTTTRTPGPCFYNPEACKPQTVWKQEIQRLPNLERRGALIKLDHSENLELANNDNFRASLKLKYSLTNPLPSSINIFYGDGQGQKSRTQFPSKNQKFDKLINNRKFFNKNFAGNISFFEHEPGHHHSHHNYDEITNSSETITRKGEAMMDITSIIKRQKNNPRINDQIFLNIDPTQKWAQELAEGFELTEISIEHFTIPASNT